MNEKELNKHFNSLSFRDLMFDPLFNTEYPYHWTDENGSIIFSKYPRYSIDKYTMTEYTDLQTRIAKAIKLIKPTSVSVIRYALETKGNHEFIKDELLEILRGEEK